MDVLNFLCVSQIENLETCEHRVLGTPMEPNDLKQVVMGK